MKTELIRRRRRQSQREAEITNLDDFFPRTVRLVLLLSGVCKTYKEIAFGGELHGGL